MIAVIHRSPSPCGAASLRVAGQPLIVRQLQWLRSCGCERVVIELEDGARGDLVLRLLAEHQALARIAVFVRSAVPLPPHQLGDRAGVPPGTPLLALSENVLGNADLSRFYRDGPGRGMQVGRLDAPVTGESFEPAEVCRITSAPGPVEVERLAGWGTVLDTPGAALRLGCEALLGHLEPMQSGGTPGVLLHAAEHSAGIWVARGGRIERGARVIPPVLIGPDARVCAGARVGPGAVIGAGAIVEAGAVVEDAVVEDDTVVGEGLRVRELIATPDGLAPLDGKGPVLSLDDPLLLARRRRPLLRRAPVPLPPSPAEHRPAREDLQPEPSENTWTDSASGWTRSSRGRR